MNQNKRRNALPQQRGPQPLSAVLSELIGRRGWAQVQAQTQLKDAWSQVADGSIAQETEVQGLKRGVLQIAVSNAPLLSELVAFHRIDLLEQIQANNPNLRIRNLKFVLQGRL
ncbi:MAG: DUF721 domain-containing protein [Planctomycetes bacterium]|nr:DUF721 domain-containing protein [Planctomycetota bacterium]